MAAPGAHSLWYIARDGQQFGPLLIHEVQERFRSGQVVPSDYMWCSEVGKWILAGEVFGAAPPPPPPSAAQHIPQNHATGMPTGRGGGADPHQGPNTQTSAGRPNQQTTTQTVIESGSFKFSTLLWIVAGLLIPLWPISLPICWFMAYKSYNKSSVRTVQVISS